MSALKPGVFYGNIHGHRALCLKVESETMTLVLFSEDPDGRPIEFVTESHISRSGNWVGLTDQVTIDALQKRSVKFNISKPAR